MVSIGVHRPLNEVYQLNDGRAWWHTKLQSLVMTLLFVLLLTVALGIVFYGDKILVPIINFPGLGGSSSSITGVIQGIALLAVMVTSTAVI